MPARNAETPLSRLWRIGMIVASAVGCARPTVRSRPGTPSSVVQALYAGVVAEAFPKNRPATILVQDHTIPYKPWLPDTLLFFHRADTLAAPLVHRLIDESREAQQVDSRWFLTRVRLLPPAAVHRLINERVRGNTRILLVSPIAFTGDSLQAMVYYEIHCIGLCGHGAALWFVRTPAGGWSLRRQLGQWDS